MHILSTLRLLRIHKGFSLSEFGAKANVSRGWLSEIERGLVSPSQDVKNRIAAALEEPVGFLFPEDGAESTP